ncbi:bifunctional tetrahydrofolate synthase/dihydrofolate synthase [Piscinibacter koreensis]|uniref:Dihydrofolate synthase/folylpolyglutamate synthase n=1 Tax=Piscinibacter koreensis TaxID=2742824 RepID=A0A7Y6TVM4_9BURK|nr:bifunctional tetrahydrofolate synthase/dihydrofolate synthase [Schlegelella koreensis]
MSAPDPAGPASASVFAPATLDDWLAHCERIHPREIELTLDRVRTVKDRLGIRFDAPLITVAGTNGKGSTCAMLESIALAAGYRVGLYSKPHLVHFEERCRIDGRMAQAAELVPHFEAVEAARGDVSLTYFEFTLLVIARLLAASDLDVVILEVGLGGRLDAVNVFDSDCQIITSIAIDHIEYLGTDREAIGREKAGVMRAGKPVIVGDPVPPDSVIEAARAIGADLWRPGVDFSYGGDRTQWSWVGRSQRWASLAYPSLRGANQLLNASAVLAAFDALRSMLPINAQAVRQGFAKVQLPGRFQIVPGRPTLVLDVSHNPHAVATLAQNLDQMGFFPRTHAVFGAMRDKDIAEMLAKMAPLVDHWHFTDLPAPRAARAAELNAIYRAVGQGAPAGASTEEHAGPVAALGAALSAADPADRIVVFGSFYTVGAVLENGLPPLAGQQPG